MVPLMALLMVPPMVTLSLLATIYLVVDFEVGSQFLC
jgi:hypothetical protein